MIQTKVRVRYRTGRNGQTEPNMTTTPRGIDRTSVRRNRRQVVPNPSRSRALMEAKLMDYLPMFSMSALDRPYFSAMVARVPFSDRVLMAALTFAVKSLPLRNPMA